MMRNLQEYLGKCIAMCEECEIPVRTVTEISTHKSKKAWGYCKTENFETFQITINEMLTDPTISADDYGLITTILHELIHTCTDCFNHGAKFQRYAEILTEKTGYSVKITDDTDGKKIDKIAFYNTFKYLYVCEKCGAYIGKSRKCDFTENTNRYFHGKCGGKFKKIEK